MPDFYTYIIAGLPMLSFSGKPAVSAPVLLGSCKGLLSEKEFSLLKAILEENEFFFEGIRALSLRGTAAGGDEAISKPGLLRPCLSGRQAFGARNDGVVLYSVLAKFFDFETALRNELAILRAGRKKQDPQKYLRPSQYWDVDVPHAAMSAYKNVSIIEAEKIVDAKRWQKLDELCFGHYFDFEFLIIYALKLKILARKEAFYKADARKELEAALN